MRAVILAATVMLAAAPADAAEPLDSLAYFVGHWRCAGTFPATGKPIAAALTFTRDDTSGALLQHHDDAPPGPYHALELWGFVKGGGFSDTIFDSYSGVRPFASPGWEGDTLTWSSAAGAARAERFSYTRLSADRMRVDWSVAKDGGYVLGDTLTCDRA